MLWFSLFWRRIKLQESPVHELVDLQNGCFVSAPVAIVWSREHRHDILLVAPVEAVHDQLVCTADKFQAIRLVKLFANILAERVASASGRNSPAHAIIGVRPEEITYGPLVWNLLDTIQLLYLVEGINTRWQSAVEAEDLVAHDSGEGKIVEELRKTAPNIRIAIFTQTFIIKSVNLGDLSAFMVSAQNRYPIRIPNFQRDKQRNSLDRIVASINIVTHEKIVGIRQFSAKPKEFFQIVKLTMNVSANCHGSFYRLNIWLFDQNLFGLAAEGSDFSFC